MLDMVRSEGLAHPQCGPGGRAPKRQHVDQPAEGYSPSKPKRSNLARFDGAGNQTAALPATVTSPPLQTAQGIAANSSGTELFVADDTTRNLYVIDVSGCVPPQPPVPPTPAEPLVAVVRFTG